MRSFKTKGFGLIELMISILVASIIVAGLYKMLSSSWLNFGISSATARSGKSARQVDNYVNNLLFQAGFVNIKNVMQNRLYVKQQSKFGTDATYYNDGDWIDGSFILGGTEANGNSKVKFRFYGSSLDDDLAGETDKTANGFIFDCRGQVVPNTVMLEVELSVNDDGLVCNQKTLVSEDGSNWDLDDPVIVDSNVKAMRILYGTTIYGRGGAFYPASSVKTHWPYINLVKYSIVTAQNTAQNIVKAQRGSTKTLFSAGDYVTNSSPCPTTEVQDRLVYAVVCDQTVGNVQANFNSYQIPDDQLSYMHKVISGTVSLVNSSNFN
ncbi:MAG: prepilin-type N-terminal cleavage/methylation domain-containing protein [Ruminobacter sp.]|uniref:PilW family protein n=1 Tax=Ruminobacter sp. TaxID=2774296 RepID=UPI001B783501|nr:prepilin-type N-terminal cleavage/methylation domain-containing protein [Ruminobacter sp.]MBP3748300.1 prepilin-type N-terminal cleavage/methylation domain-containing protein [Ruminobacter sp.]